MSRRLVSLAPSVTELAYVLGQERDLVGVTAFCDFPAQARQLPRLPGWSDLSVEQVLALKPDLAVTSTVVQAELAAGLKASGVPVLHMDPRSLDQVPESFIDLARALGVEARGIELAAAFKAELQLIAAGVPESAKRPRVYIEEWSKPPMVSGNWVPELAALAGAAYFPQRAGQPSQAISWEDLMEFDPELIVYSVCGLAKAHDPAGILSIEGWDKLDAVRAKQVYSVDDSLFNRPGPRLIEGARLLQALLGQLAWDRPAVDPNTVRRLP